MRTEALACRLTKRSALLLLASAARSSRSTVASASRVRITRTPSRASSAALRRRATLRVTFFSSVPPGPWAPSSVPPCPASTTIVRMPPVGAEIKERGRARGRRAHRRRWRWCPRRRRGGLGDDIDDDAAGTAVARQIRCAVRAEARPEVDDDAGAVAGANRLNEIWRRERGQHRIEGIGLELDDKAIAVLRDRMRRLRRDVKDEPHHRAERFDAAADPRYADVSRDDEPRHLAQVERRSERRRQRARHEIHGDEPGAAIAYRRRWQRNQSTGNRGQALARRQDYGLGTRRDGQAARQTVFADGQIEELRQVVERKHLLPIDEPGGECAAAFSGQDSVWCRCRRRLRSDRSKREEKRACS